MKKFFEEFFENIAFSKKKGTLFLESFHIHPIFLFQISL